MRRSASDRKIQVQQLAFRVWTILVWTTIRWAVKLLGDIDRLLRRRQGVKRTLAFTRRLRATVVNRRAVRTCCERMS